MWRALLLCTVLLISAACGRENEVAPTLAGEAAGTYLTNGFLDYVCIALPANQLPTVSVREESASAVAVTYLQRYPARRTRTFSQVLLQRLPDNSIQLTYQGKAIGSIRTDRVFTNNGLERQGLLLRIAHEEQGEAVVFTGAK